MSILSRLGARSVAAAKWGARRGGLLDTPLYHGTRREVVGDFIRPTKTVGFPEPMGVSLTPDPSIARDFGNTIYPMAVRGKYGDAEAFMRRARELMAHGVPEAEASARTQQEFVKAGYAGVRWGNREVVVFDPLDARSTQAAFGLEGPGMMLGIGGGLFGLSAYGANRAGA